MTHREYMNICKQMEQRLPVENWKIQNVHVWPFLRILMGSVVRRTINDRKLRGDQGDNKSLFVRGYNKISFVLKHRRRSLIGQLNLRSKAIRADLTDEMLEDSKFDLLFLSVTSTRMRIGTQWFDQQSDPFLLHLENSGVKSLVLERNNGTKFKTPIYFPENSFNLDNYIERKMIKRDSFQSSAHPQLDGYQEFLKTVNKRFANFNLDHIVNPDELTIEIEKLRWQSNLFKKIITKSGVKICFITNYDTNIGMAMCNACYELNIPAVDLQHGSQGDLHHGYGRWSNVPEGGFNTLPSIYWNWNKEQQDQIESWAAKGNSHRSILGGNPWVSLWESKKNGLMNNYEGYEKAFRKTNEDEVHILYTMQAELDYSLTEYIINAYKNSPKNWTWWFRLHPRQLNNSSQIVNAIKKIINIKDSKIKLASELPLPLILNHMDVHVTQSSSVVIDAGSFNIPSIVTREIAIEFYKHLIENGMVHYCNENEDNLIEAIKKQLNYKSEQPERVDAFLKFDQLLNEYEVI